MAAAKWPDAVGKSFGKLTVVSRDTSGGRRTMLNTVCECGTEGTVDFSHLMAGKILSCGCSKRKHQTPKAHTLPEYRTWCAMRSRCLNPNSVGFRYYGGRGIGICEEWANNFDAFYMDMGSKPSMSHSIDRRDVNADYSPSNCEWATKAHQAGNQRRTKTIMFKGERVAACKVAAECGIPYRTFYGRVFVYGWSVDEAVSTPVMPRGGNHYSTRRKYELLNHE